MTGRPADVEKRLLRNTYFCPITGCWLWHGTMYPTGYGTISFNGKHISVHRLAYIRAYGPIPKGLVVDHICHMRACVNPDHLRLLTIGENVMADNSLSLPKLQSLLTCCPKCGGPYTLDKYGARRCPPCRRERRNARYAERKQLDGATNRFESIVRYTD